MLNKILILIVGMLLVGCDSSQHIQDLHEYMNNLKQKIIHYKNEKNAPSFKIPQEEHYQITSGRTPFESTIEKKDNKNPLSYFPLNQLRLMLVLTSTSKPWVFVLAPNKKIYQLTIGDVIGSEGGKIIKINENFIEIAEPDTNIISLPIHSMDVRNTIHQWFLHHFA